MINNKLIHLLGLSTILIITIMCYANGLTGGYLLDDIPNLQNIDVFSRFEGLEGFIRYIMSYEAGPLKRPISTLSFLLNATTLTVNAFYFKLTNILIHVFNGLLLYLVTVNLLRTQQYKNKDIQFIALATMSLWLLHPFFVSTTLYVIQRMAMLPVTFVLLGMILYLKARTLRKAKTRLAVFYILLSVYLCTLLAVLSKENGVILPVLILFLEVVVLRNTSLVPLNKMQKGLIVFPVILIVLAFVYQFPSFLKGYEIRHFSMLERLLTESRVLMDYLGHLFVPRFESAGVYSDGFIISTSLFSPITTIISITIIVAILIFAFIIRIRKPLISFSIFFYFIGHIIESSFVGLEIYFEHRNYLPALFLFLPLPLLLTKYLSKYNLNVLILICVSFYLANTTYKKTLLWSDTTQLMLTASENNPKSIRAIDEKIRYHFQNSNTHLAIDLLKKSIKRFPNTLFRVNLINLKCFNKTANLNDFKELNDYINKNAYNKHDAESIAGLLNILINDTCLDNNLELAYQLINTLKKQPSFKIIKVQKPILFAEIYLRIKLNEFELINKKIDHYLTKHHDFNEVIFIIDQLIASKKYQLAKKAVRNLEGELLLKKYRYTDRDYLYTVSILKNKLK